MSCGPAFRHRCHVCLRWHGAACLPDCWRGRGFRRGEVARMLDRGDGFAGVHPQSPLVYEAVERNQMRMQRLQHELQELRRLELESEPPWWLPWRLQQLGHELEELWGLLLLLRNFFTGRERRRRWTSTARATAVAASKRRPCPVARPRKGPRKRILGNLCTSRHVFGFSEVRSRAPRM